MNLKTALLFSILSATCLSLFVNCSPYAVDPNLQISSLSSPNINPGSSFDSAYLDGLATGTTQTGALFARDPSSASGQDRLGYGVDLSPYVVQTQIKHLDGSKSYLTDGFVSFQYMDAQTGTSTTYASATVASPSTSLVYPQSDGRFQQVNAYYHTDRLIADLKGQNLFPALYKPIQVYAKCSAGSNNAYYDYENLVLCLGYTSLTPRVWAADDADVITHEFGHSLNHTYSTNEILSSTSETGALDEAFADLWAYRNSGDPRVSRWYGRALDSRNGTGAYPGLRNLDNTLSYPSAIDYEIHDDSRMISAAVKAVEGAANMDSTTLAKFEKRLLEDLPFGGGFADVIQSMQDEASALGYDPSSVTVALNARGLYRKDLASEISLDSAKPVYVIDNHDSADPTPDSNLAGGNCNGALDAGETALLFPNLRNAGAMKGAIQMTLTSQTTGVSVLKGGDYAFAARIPANTTYLAGELTPSSSTKYEYSGAYGTRLLPMVFYVKVAAGVSGNANFTLHVKTMNTIDAAAQTVDLPVSLPIGSVATQSSCASLAVDRSVYP